MKKPTASTATPQLQDFKGRIAQQDQSLSEKFWAGEDIRQLVRSRSNFVDGFLTELWQGSFERSEPIALFAVGGYGRGELHPHSDVDLLILIRRDAQRDQRIEAFVRNLWDLNLDIGHSVRTVSECKQEARKDLSVVTALMERRFLTGSSELAQKLETTLNSRFLWPSKRFFEAKRGEQAERHEQFSDVDYDLEPNIKNSPGGLRDLQTIGWITKKHFETDSVDELQKLGILTQQERDTFLEGCSFLWKVRFALHLITQRKEDQLSFDYQREIARRFGYEDSDGLLSVEKFMRDYYRYVLDLREVNDILLQHFDEVILRGRRRDSIQPLNERFQICNHYIEVTHDKVFVDKPSSIMELFVIMANNESIKGVRASTIRLIRQHLHLINEEFRQDPAVGNSFIELLRSPYTVVSQLTRMRRYGILGRYIPVFGKVIGQMQHDLFHIYTVDAHTMMVIRQMRRFFMPSHRDSFPFVIEALQHIKKVELLFLAGLFHDIGKGRGGNHSQLGAVDAEEFCGQLGLVEEDIELVSWLVTHHLELSTTAQRKDIEDPKVITKFADLVETEQKLSYLVALTVADINATNPSLWNGWRASLIGKLYRSTRETLRNAQSGTSVPSQHMMVLRADTLAELSNLGISKTDAERIWEDSNEGVFAHQNVKHATEITSAIHNHDFNREPLVLVLDVFGSSKGEEATEIFVCTTNRENLFADCVATLDQLHLQVLNAKIDTGISQRCYDSFFVLDTDGQQIVDHGVKQKIRNRLVETIKNSTPVARSHKRRISRQLRQFVLPSSVTMTKPNEEGLSTLELIVSDRPGLLALVGELFVELGVEIHEARIATLGERVEDLFLISGKQGQPLSDSEQIQSIVDSITKRIDAEIEEVA